SEPRPLGPFGRRDRLALPEDHAVDGSVAEETVHPLDDHRRQMLEQRRMGALDQQGQCSARLAASRKAQGFGQRDSGVALADDLGPAADDRALDEAEAAERLAADLADEVADGARPAASLALVL